MATYTRQSSFSDGDSITAALFNDEFNQLVNAFHASTGHTHDGTTAANGGPISVLYSNAITFGTNADTDIAITFNASSNDGVLTWMEDEDYFKFSDDILINSTEKVQFRDSAIYIYSSADGQLDLVADTEIQIAATTIDINGAADISGNLAVGGNLTVTGTATIAGNLTFGDAASDTVAFSADVASHLLPSSDDTYDLGASGSEWRDLYLDGTAYVDTISLNGTAITATAAELNIMDGVTATASELNIMDGVTASTSELNIMDGVTATASELNILDGVTATATELNILDGVTATTSELNIMDGVTATASELNIMDGVTATTAELNILDGATVVVGELNYLDLGSTSVGTAIASKAVVLDSNKDYTGLRNLTITGELDAATLDISGDADIDGTLEADAITIAGVTLAETIADTVGAMVGSNTESGIAVTYDDSDNTLDFAVTVGASEITDNTVGADELNVSGDGTSGQVLTSDGDGTFSWGSGGKTDEEIQDIVGAMFSSNTETGITATYQDGDGTVDLVVGTLNQDTTGNAATFTATANDSTDETVYPIFVDGATGAQGAETDTGLTYNPSSGKLTATEFVGNIDAVDGDFDGTLEADAITVAGTALNEYIADTVGAMVSSNTETGITVTYEDGDNTLDFAIGTLNQDTTGSAATLTTARTIHGVSFDGSANIDLSEVIQDTVGAMFSSNTETGITVTYEDGDGTIDLVVGTLNQNTTGNAATATLATTVTVSDSTANTNFPVVFHDESNALLDDTGALRYNPSTGTLLVPNLSVAGTTTTVDTVTMEASNAIIFEGATADSNETTLSIVDPTSDHTQYLVNQGGYIPVLAAATTTQISATPAELNILDGVTATTAELNILDGVTSTASELNILDGVTSTATELNLLDGSTANTVVNSKAVVYGSSGELAGTLSTAAQGNVTSLGTLTTLTVDNVIINGTTIGHTSDTDLITLADGNVTIAGELDLTTLDVSGNADIDGTLEADAITVDGTALNEYIADTIGAMVGSNTETGITVTYEDGDNTLDFVIGTLNQDTTGNAATATALETARTIHGVSFDGTANIDLSEVVQDTAGGMFTGNTETFITATYQDSDGTVDLVVPVLDEDNLSTDSASHLATQQSIKAYVDSQVAGAGSGDITGVTIQTDTGSGSKATDESGSADFILQGGNGIGVTNSSATITVAVDAAQTSITSLLATDIKIGEDDQTKIDFETADTINFYAGNEKQLILTDGALTPGADNILDLGSSSLEFKDAYFDGTVTADAFAGPLTGDVTGNVSGTAATVTGAAQSNITSLGTLTTLTVDDITINGSTISDGGDLTLDIGGDIILDADGDDIFFAAAGTNFGKIVNSSSDFMLRSLVQDKDIIFKGDDGGMAITALTIDMSDAGTAIFNHDIKLADNGIARFGTGEDLLIFHDGSSNYILSNTSDQDLLIQGNDGGSTITALSFDMSAAGAATFNDKIIATELDISGNVDIDGTLEADAITINGTTLSETIADTVGAMVGSNTESGITVAYQDGDNTLDFTVGTLNQDTTGNAATATALETARTIHGVSFDGTANIDLTEVVEDTVGAMFSGNTETGITATYQDGDGTIDLAVGTLNQDTTGNAATATALATARTIGGTSFDGTGNIAVALSTEATNITVSANNSTNETVYPVFVDGTTGTQGAETDSGFTYNPSSGLLTISGELDAGSLDISGDADIDGTLETDNLTIGGSQGSDGQVLTSTGSGVAWEDAAGGGMTSFQLEDGDGTEVAVSDGKEVKFVEGTGIDINWTDTSTGSDGDPYDLTFTNTGVTSIVAGSNISIDSSTGAVTITGTDTNTTYSAGTNISLSGTTFNVDDAFLKNDANDTTSGTITAGGFTTSGSITLGGHSFNDIDIGSEFVDTDDHLMSSGAIKEKIEDYGYTTNTGDITGVTAGVGLSGGGSSGGVTLTLDMSELTDMTADVNSSQDELIILDNGADRRKLISEIPLSAFNNDSGFTTTSGDITAVTAGTNCSGGGSSGAVTINVDDAFLINSGNDTTSGTITAAGFTTSGSSGEITGAEITATKGLYVGNGTATHTQDEIIAEGNITAYYSDARLKDFEGKIPNALDKVSELNGYYFKQNDKGNEFLPQYADRKQVGVSAQEVEKVMPEVVVEAAIGEGYKSVHYDKLVPLLIEAIKELKAEIKELKKNSHPPKCLEDMEGYEDMLERVMNLEDGVYKD